jgi:hypothetical protein
MNPGRNDPCPCGSGKKYKKCCLNKNIAFPVPSLEETKLGDHEKNTFPESDSDSFAKLAGFFSSDALGTEMEEWKKYCESEANQRRSPLSFQQWRGRGNLASDFLADLSNRIAGREFESEEDLKGFFDLAASEYNSSDQIAHYGLSPEEIRQLIDEELAEIPGLLQLNTKNLPSDFKKTRAFKTLKLMSELLAKNNQTISLTTKGNLSPALCRDFATIFKPEVYQYKQRIIESDVPFLRVIVDVLIEIGWLGNHKKHLFLTKKGSKEWINGKESAAFSAFFFGFLEEVDQSSDFEDAEIALLVEEHYAVMLYLLNHKRRQWVNGRELARLMTKKTLIPLFDLMYDTESLDYWALRFEAWVCYFFLENIAGFFWFNRVERTGA